MRFDCPMAMVRSRFRSLETLGVAIEHFPHYHNPIRRMHSVEVVLFSVAVRGRGRHYIDNEAFDFRAGSVGITSPGQRHDVVTARSGIEKFNLFLDVQSHLPPEMPVPLRTALRSLIQTGQQPQDRPNRAAQFEVGEANQLRSTLQRIAVELRDRQEGYADVVRGCLANFLIDCCRAANRSALTSAETSPLSLPFWIGDVRKKLDDHYTKRWTLEELSRDYGVSAGHLNRVFSAYTGRSVADYLIDRRVRAAMRYLETEDWKIARIAAELSFTDGSYLHRQFKLRTGMTPAEYRRRQRQERADG